MSEAAHPSAPTQPDRPAVHGQGVDDQTRCSHYASAVDVIAIRMHCCRTYYACRQCHDEAVTHAATLWPSTQWETEDVILCGVCSQQFSIRAYLQCGHQCPHCAHPFNPRCALHYSLYFAMNEEP